VQSHVAVDARDARPSRSQHSPQLLYPGIIARELPASAIGYLGACVLAQSARSQRPPRAPRAPRLRASADPEHLAARRPDDRARRVEDDLLARSLEEIRGRHVRREVAAHDEGDVRAPVALLANVVAANCDFGNSFPRLVPAHTTAPNGGQLRAVDTAGAPFRG
jgi:hypothetical protein